MNAIDREIRLKRFGKPPIQFSGVNMAADRRGENLTAYSAGGWGRGFCLTTWHGARILEIPWHRVETCGTYWTERDGRVRMKWEVCQTP